MGLCGQLGDLKSNRCRGAVACAMQTLAVQQAVETRPGKGKQLQAPFSVYQADSSSQGAQSSSCDPKKPMVQQGVQLGTEAQARPGSPNDPQSLHCQTTCLG